MGTIAFCMQNTSKSNHGRFDSPAEFIGNKTEKFESDRAFPTDNTKSYKIRQSALAVGLLIEHDVPSPFLLSVLSYPFCRIGKVTNAVMRETLTAFRCTYAFSFL